MSTSVRSNDITALASFFALSIGLCVLAGWAVDDDILKRIAPRFVAMNPATAACFVVLGLSLLPAYAPYLRMMRCAAGLAVFSVGLLKLADLTSGTRFGIDEYLFASKLGSHGEHPMAESTAVMFVFLGAATGAFALAKRWAIVVGQTLAAGCLLLTFLAVIGYLYGELGFYSMGYFPMALHTALAGLIVSIGLFALHPRRGVMKVLTSSDLGGTTARKLLPSVVGIPLVLGMIWLFAQGSVSPVMGVALFVTANILLLAAIVLWISKRLHTVSQRLRIRSRQLENMQARLRAAGILLRDKNTFLEAEVASRTADLQCVQEVTIHALASLAESRDGDTGNHIRRTQHYVRMLAKRLQTHPRFASALTDAAIDLMFRSAPLHDIGKVGIPDDILLKPGPLTRDEFEIMKTHTTIGRDALERAERTVGRNVDFLRFAKEMAYSHQEKWDGSGYPQGICGDDIPVAARLMAVADVYDALTSNRVYKRALPHAEAVAIIMNGRETHFDPDVADAFYAINDDFYSAALQYADDEGLDYRGGIFTVLEGIIPNP